FEVGLLEGAEKAERVEIGFEVAPAAEGGEDALAVLRGGLVRICLSCWLLACFRGFRGAFCFESGSVGHKVVPANFYFAIEPEVVLWRAEGSSYSERTT